MTFLRPALPYAHIHSLVQRLALGVALLAVPPALLARAPAAPPAASAPATPASAPGAYRQVELATWVPPLRAPGRIILQPQGVSFQAELGALPRAQKAEYLQKALELMHMSEPPRVSQAVLLRYGPAPDQQLVAYIEDAAAARLAKELKPGDVRQFYAFHVYNYAKGPALVVTSFGPLE